MKARFYLAAALVLAATLSAGTVLYVRGDDAQPAGSYVIANGVAYPVPAQASRTYVRELRRFGGRSAVLFAEFDAWFAGLWRGKTLGMTITVLGAAFAGVLFIAGRHSA